MYQPTPSTFIRYSLLGTRMAVRFPRTPSTVVYTRRIITSTNTNTSTPRARYLSCKGYIWIVYVYVYIMCVQKPSIRLYYNKNTYINKPYWDMGVYIYKMV